MPIAIKIIDGTGKSLKEGLCKTCHNGTVLKGESGSQELTYCHVGMAPFRIPFRVAECNSYSDSRIPSLSLMKDQAWVVRTDKNGRKIGFTRVKDMTEDERRKLDVDIDSSVG